MKDKATMVKEWCLKNEYPVQILCPVINQTIHTSKGWEMWNSKTGQRNKIDWDPNRWSENRARGIENVCGSRSYEYESFYIRYVKQLDALEVSHICMEGNRGKDGVPREWYYGNGRCYTYQTRLFLFHDDPNAYTKEGDVWTGGKYYSHDMKEALHDWQRKCLFPQEGMKELQKFDKESGITRTWGDREYMYGWDFVSWYEKSFIKRNKSKTYTELKDYKLEDIQVPNLEHGHRRGYYQKLDEKNCVIRVYDSEWTRWDPVTRSYPPTPAKEICRVFISNKGKATIMGKEGNGWVIKANLPYGATGRLDMKNEEEMFQWKPLKYIRPCFDMRERRIFLDDLIAILRHPIIEQIYKAGYPKTALHILQHDGVPSYLRDYFGVEKEKKQPLFKLLKCNKFLLKAIENSEDGRGCPIPKIAEQVKYFYGSDDASNATEDVINAIADYLQKDPFNHIADLCPGKTTYNTWRYGHQKNFASLTDEDRKWIMKLFRMEQKHLGSIRLYTDVISTYNRINEKPELNLYNIQDYNDMERMHDALVAIQIREQSERRAMYSAEEAERLKLEKRRLRKGKRNA